MKIVPGGVGMVYAPNDLGYPWASRWIRTGSAIATSCGLCVTDPKRIKRTWTQAGSDMFGTEVDTPVQEELVVFCDMITGVCNVEILPIRDIASAELLAPMFSVVRTGAGDLGAAAAGDLRMDTPYGFYTAGTPSTALRRADGSDPYAQPRGKHIFDPAGARASLAAGPAAGRLQRGQRRVPAWYPERGGNVDIVVGGSVSGDAWTEFAPPNRPQTPSASVGNWLWRQGSDALPASWWINFGAYAVPMATNMWASSHPYIVGFTGFGTLGGGNHSIAAAGGAGIVAARGLGDYARNRAAAPGRGRGRHRRRARRQPGADRRRRPEAAPGRGPEPGPGRLAVRHAVQDQSPEARPGRHGDQLAGRHPDRARAIGGSRQLFRQDAVAQPGLTGDAMDPRPINPFVPTLSSASGGITLVPGDSAVYLETMGDLVLSGVSDAGRVRVLNTSIQAPGRLSVGGSQSWFSLWTPATAINLLSAGGNVTPDTSLSHEAAGSASVIRGTT